MKQKKTSFLARAAMTLAVLLLGSAGAWAQILVDGASYIPYDHLEVINYSMPNSYNISTVFADGRGECQKISDGETSTKWCYVQPGTDALPTLTIDFRITTSEQYTPVIKGYVLVTGDDTETYPNRNPTKWKLYGASSANGPWVPLDERNTTTNSGSADKLPERNLAEKSYLIPYNSTYNTPNTPYSFYRLEITGVDGYELQSGGNYHKYICQLSEFHLFGNAKSEDDYNINNCTISGLETPLTWTGNAIETSSIAYTLMNNKNFQAVHPNFYTGYFYPSTESNSILYSLPDAGFYKLTVGGRSLYKGLKNFKFAVAKESLTGAGTEESPYLINDLTDWNTFAVKVVYDNANYGDKYYKLTTDLSGVTAMVGSSSSPFKGHFDGDGHTLNLNLSADGICCAPFRYVKGTSNSNRASIRRLHTTGTVTAGSQVLDDMNMYRSGLIGDCGDYVNIDNCWSSVTINSSLAREGGHGGFIGNISAHSSGADITNCLFDGTITGSTTTRCGGFVGDTETGWSVTINNCLMRGTLDVSFDANDSKNSATFSRAKIISSSSSKYYYVNAYGTVQGTAVGTMTNTELLAALGNQWEIVNDMVVPIIDAKDLSLGSIECSGNFPWTGQELNVVPVVKDMDGHVVDAANYSVSFDPSPVKNSGTYTMTVTGNANGYRRSLTHQFKVSEYPDGMYEEDDHYAINLPIGNKTTTLDISQFALNSFKVYDDGGKDGNYSGSGNLKIIAPEGKLIRITGHVLCNAYSSYLSIYDGSEKSNDYFIGKSRYGSAEGDGEDIGTQTSTGREMILTFSHRSNSMAGLDLTVTLIDASTPYNITVVNPDTEKGTVNVSPTSAAVNSEITVTVTPASGYRLCDLQATDAFGNFINLSHLLWYNNTSTGTFKMASSDVTITPTFTNVWTADGGLYVNMPTGNTQYTPLTIDINTETPSVKIYDDGGKDHNTGFSRNGYLLLNYPSGYRLILTGTMNGGKLLVKNGDNTSATQLFSGNATGETINLGSVTGSNKKMLIIYQTFNDYYDGINLTATLFDPNCTEVSVAMNDAGIRTYSSMYALDLNSVDAYVVSKFDNGNATLTLTKVTEAPANTGLLLKVANDEQKGTDITLPVKADATLKSGETTITTNYLKPVVSPTTVQVTEGDNTNFVLANGDYGIDWYTLSADGAIGANKAYLQLPSSALTGGGTARGFSWVYEDASGISSVTMDNGNGDDVWHSLNGVRFSSKPTKRGIYVKNGKMVVIK